MAMHNTPGTVFIKDNTAQPTALAIETEAYLPGWRVVRNLDGYGLGRKIEQAKWNFFYLAGDIRAAVLGREGPDTVRKAVSRALAKSTGESFNSLEITKVVSKWFFVIPYTRITAHFRHIQQAICLQPSGNDFDWRVSSAPSEETLARRQAALFAGS